MNTSANPAADPQDLSATPAPEPTDAAADVPNTAAPVAPGSESFQATQPEHPLAATTAATAASPAADPFPEPLLYPIAARNYWIGLGFSILVGIALIWLYVSDIIPYGHEELSSMFFSYLVVLGSLWIVIAGGTTILIFAANCWPAVLRAKQVEKTVQVPAWRLSNQELRTHLFSSAYWSACRLGLIVGFLPGLVWCTIFSYMSPSASGFFFLAFLSTLIFFALFTGRAWFMRYTITEYIRNPAADD